MTLPYTTRLVGAVVDVPLVCEVCADDTHLAESSTILHDYRHRYHPACHNLIVQEILADTDGRRALVAYHAATRKVERLTHVELGQTSPDFAAAIEAVLVARETAYVHWGLARARVMAARTDKAIVDLNTLTATILDANNNNDKETR